MTRLSIYYARNGFLATVRRAALAVRRALFSNRMILFSCELSGQASSPADFSSFLKVERKRNYAELSPQDTQEILNIWNPKLAHRNIKERFGQGASFWLIKCEGRLAGYGWTLQGRTIEPHYFLLGQDDVHLFDFHVFPAYRGRGMNPFLVTYILRSLATDGASRAFIECAEWNQAQLASLRKTSFRRLGWAKKSMILRHTIMGWAENENAQQTHNDKCNKICMPVTNQKRPIILR
jgi:ribosomal protein S18 acetylase RimI-like enzyme